MTDTNEPASPTDDPGAAPHRPSRLNQALAWVGIAAGSLFVVGGIFLAGFFLNYSEHAHMQMGHAAMAHDAKDCCADMKHGDMMKPGDMKPAGMMGPQSGR